MNLQKIIAQSLADYLGTQLAAYLNVNTPSAPTVAPQGTPGVSTVSYRIVAVSRGGKVSAASTAGTTITSNAALSATNFNRITWAAVDEADGYLIYRTAGGPSQGLIKRVAPGMALQVDDTGLAGDGTSVPAAARPRVTVGQEDPDAGPDYPQIVILPQRLTFEASLAVDELDLTDEGLAANQAVVDVGAWTGNLEIRVTAKDKPQRETIQAAIQALFMAGGTNPASTKRGIIVTTTPALTFGATVTTYQAPCAFSIMGDQWNEELVFDKKRYTFMQVETSVPALVLWEGIYTIEEYHLALTHDMDSVNPVLVDATIIDEDGNMTPTTPPTLPLP